MNAAVTAPARTLRICVVAERMTDPLDEGGRKFAYLMASALEKRATVRRISVGGAVPDTNGNIRVPRSRTFAAKPLRDAVRGFAPDAICYVPEASLTVFSALRARLLKLAFPAARVAVVAVQERSYSWRTLQLMRHLRPDLVLTLSRNTAEGIARLGGRTSVLPPAVELERFRPVDVSQRNKLRRKYGLDEAAFLVLHVGHTKWERGVHVLGDLGRAAQGVLVAARSEGGDPELAEYLRGRGAIVIDDFQPDINELYQASDCYMFPVLQADASIDAPLSVLEAMACNLPVVTTPFGSLPDIFSPGPGFRFATTIEELVAAVEDRGWMAGQDTREMVSRYSWDNAAQALVTAIEEVR